MLRVRSTNARRVWRERTYGRPARTSRSACRSRGSSSGGPEGSVATATSLLRALAGNGCGDRVRPVVERMLRDDSAAQLGAGLRAGGRGGGGEAGQPFREPLGVTRHKAELDRQPIEELGQSGVARDHWHGAGGRLVDDF